MYDNVVFERIEELDREAYYIDFDLWTVGEDQCDLALELRVLRTPDDFWDVEIWDLHTQ